MPRFLKGLWVITFALLCVSGVSCGGNEDAGNKGVKRAQAKALKKIKKIGRETTGSEEKLLVPGKIGKKGKKGKRGKGQSCTVCKPCSATSDCANSETCKWGKCMQPCDTKDQGPNDCPKRTACKSFDQGGKTHQMCLPKKGCTGQFQCGANKGGKRKGGKKKGKKGKKSKD